MREPFYAGIVAPPGPAQEADFSSLTRGRLHLVRLNCADHSVEDLPRWRSCGALEFILQLHSSLPAQVSTSALTFVEAVVELARPFVAQGVLLLEIQDGPNRPERGMGVSWSDGAGFCAWFIEVSALLRARLGSGVQIGFPALDERLGDWQLFKGGCTTAMEQADWVALHLSWTTAAEMCGYEGMLCFLRRYLEVFPEQTFWITECGNFDVATTSQARGTQYADLMTLLSQYDQLGGACLYPWRSSDPQLEPLGCLAADGTSRPAFTALASRPVLLDPFAARMVWPSEYRKYNQYFGENQAWYQQTSHLNAGHNGVDLRVNGSAPQQSPIRAALAGSVIQVAFDETGYGHHVRVRSYGPQHEEILLIYGHLSDIHVSQGMLVQAGDIVGMAGSTGMSTGPHLHLGMKVSTVPLPVTNGWLNPRPYLEAPLRGQPRVQYARTYLLLPPAAGAEWAGAVVRSVWERWRFTVGGSADDAGIGALNARRVVAINPGGWNGDLAAFFQQFYPGVIYLAVEAVTPDALAAQLTAIPDWAVTGGTEPLPGGGGSPREAYERSYVLLPPGAGGVWAQAVVETTWEGRRFTVGGSADDAGIGDLPLRRVLAVNPAAWGDDLRAFFRTHYPGVEYVPLTAATPDALRGQLLPFSQFDIH